MDDNDLTTLLRKAAADFDPSRAHVNLDQARKSGRRRHLLTRGVATATGALAFAGLAAGLFVALPHGATSAGSLAPATSQTPAAPATLAADQPVTLPASFGWLPAGFSPQGVTLDLDPADSLESLFAGPPGVGLLNLDVSDGKHPGGTWRDTVTAPDVNGKPAKWYSDGLEWEFAPDEWAQLSALSGLHGPPANWDVSIVPRDEAASSTPSTEKALAQTKSDLLRIATHVQWNRQQVKFPYQLTHALPASWISTLLIGNYVNGIPTALSITLQEGTSMRPVVEITDQPFSVNGQTCTGPAADAHVIKADGVQWTYQTQDTAGNSSFPSIIPIRSATGTQADYLTTTQGICSDAPVDGRAVILEVNRITGIETVKDGVTRTTSLKTGAAESALGGVKTLFSWLKFLGPNPANWTTRPFAG